MKYWRGFFVAAALLNFFGGAMGLFSLERPFVEAGLPVPNYPFFAHTLFLAVIILGVGYLMVAADPPANRNIVWLGLLTKIAGMVTTWLAVKEGQLPAEPFAMQPLFADLPWAIGFSLFLWKTRSSPQAT